MKGCPLRMCKELENLDFTGVTDAGLTNAEMYLVKEAIKDMWLRAATEFEVCQVKGEESAGFRFWVRKDRASKLTILKEDAIPMGWLAEIPESLLSYHIFKRSFIDPNNYLGGPFSFVKWCTTFEETAHVCTTVCGSDRHICKVWTEGALPPGTELMWAYGSGSFIPKEGEWFKQECCSVSTCSLLNEKRLKKKDICRKFMFPEMCVLCGFKISSNNKENRSNHRPHLAGSHADFFGSDWDGSGDYSNEIVDPNLVFQKVDECIFLLQSLWEMNWKVLPACTVFTKEELQQFQSEESTMHNFKRMFDIYKKAGILVLRGCEVPTTAAHLQPLNPRVWKLLTWKTHDGKPPPSGRYAVPEHLKEAHKEALPTFLHSVVNIYSD